MANLKKVLKITNSGGKTCLCTIFKKNRGSQILAEEEVEEKFKTFDSFATEIMDELINNVFETFRFSEKYCIEVKPYSTKNINVVFSPEYKGFHCENVTFLYQSSDGDIEQKIQLTGDVAKIPIRVEPSVIDLKTCVMNSGVYQGIFTVFNESSKTFPVTAKIPQSLKNHCHVFPSEPIIQSSGSCTFSITFYPRSSLPEEGGRYYCKETQLLEFPVFIHQCSSHSCKPEHLKVYVFALITDYILELNPPYISFGTVTTLETVRKEIYLTNHSLSVQEYGFLNLPKGVRIEPNLGFGRIFPKETLKLFVLVSPLVEHIDDNNLGLTNLFSFDIKVTSIAEFGGFGKEDGKSEAKAETESLWPEDYSLEEKSNIVDSASEESKFHNPDFKMAMKKKIGSIEKPGDKDENLPLNMQEKEQKIREIIKIDHLSEFSFFNRVMKKSDHFLTSDIYKIEELGEAEEFSIASFDDRKNKNVISCDSYIVKLHCELSSSVIQLPATPCSSFSLTKFYISGKNASMTSKCYCGLKGKLSKKNNSDVKFYFEFQYDCPGIKIEPQSGCLEYGKVLPITIIFKPEFPAEILRYESKMQKSIKIFDEMQKEKEAADLATSANLAKGKKDKNQKSALSFPKYENPEEILNSPLCVLRKNDFFLGEKNLYQTMSPFCKETRVLCIVKSEESEVNEAHEMIIIAPAIKPDFIFLGDSQEFSFGKVPTGITSKSILKIQNIQMERISPSLSILNPFGPFVCPLGKVELDPEHIWNITLAFTPFEEKEITEFFEIRSGKTIFAVKVSGAGINPEYLISPDFALSRIEAKKGGFSEFKFDFQNLNEANLPLNFVKEFTKELTSSPPLSTQEKQKKKLSKLQTDITEDVIFQLENDYEDVVDGNLIFTIIGFEDKFIVPSFATINIKIRFQPPGEADKTYVSKYKIILGRNRVLKEFLIFGTVTKGK